MLARPTVKWVPNRQPEALHVSKRGHGRQYSQGYHPKTSGDRQPPRDPPPIPAAVGGSSNRRVWRNLSILGLGLFAAGAFLEFSGAPACGFVGLFGLILWLVAGGVAWSMKP